MASIQAMTVIGAPIDRVYAQAKDVERFPEFMPDVERVTVLERGLQRTVTAWVGVVQGRKIRWTEEDDWDDARHVCTFRQRHGDFNRFGGEWRFEALPEGTRATLVIDYELDIPFAGALLSNLVRVLMRKNAESMLAALKDRIERGGKTVPAARRVAEPHSEHLFGSGENPDKDADTT